MIQMTSLLFQVTDPTNEEIAAKADTVKAQVVQFAENFMVDPTAAVSQLGIKLLDFSLKVLVAILIYIIGIWLIKKIKKALAAVFQKKKADKAIASFLTSFVSVMLTVLLFIITVGTLGVNTTSLAALLAAGGMAIGMALSGTVQNFSGGIMILAFKPFKVGDLISAQGYTGTVSNISIVNTSITTSDHRVIIIPNGTLFSSTIDNTTRLETRRVEWTIGLDYGTDADRCIEAILEILRSDGRVLDTSTAGASDPFVGILALSSSSVDFTVRAWVKTADYWPVFFDIQKTLYTELQKKGFSFPFPQLDVHVRN